MIDIPAPQAAQTNQHGARHPFVDRTDFDAEEGKPFVQPGEVLHVARDLVKRLDDDDLEPLLAGGLQKVEPAVAAENRCTRPRLVLETADDLQPL